MSAGVEDFPLEPEGTFYGFASVEPGHQALAVRVGRESMRVQ